MTGLYIFLAVVVVVMAAVCLIPAVRYYKRGDKPGVLMSLGLMIYGIVGVSVMTIVIANLP